MEKKKSTFTRLSLEEVLNIRIANLSIARSSGAVRSRRTCGQQVSICMFMHASFKEVIVTK